MGIGTLQIQVRTGDDALPVGGAHVTLSGSDNIPLYETYTDASGSTEKISLPAPDVQYTLDPTYTLPAYSIWTVTVESRGYVTIHIRGVEVVDTQDAILPVKMKPVADEANPVLEEEIEIPPVGLLIPDAGQTDPPEPFRIVTIPEYITVHLGAPANAAARNVKVKFPEYIKNVVSSEIYSTWPESALIANIHVIVTFALNRIYTEWYRSRGFAFDITNNTGYDQYFREGAQIFANISKLVDNLFNTYARRQGFRNPFFTSFCNGTTATCPGLSQWGTVTLANQGMTPIQILHYYYPDDLELTSSDNIAGIVASYPGTPLRAGSQGDAVRRMQNYLNRIRVNYPLIQQISNPNGVFGTDTEQAVRTFQRAFNLTMDGIIGAATWNKISFIYVGVTRLAELDSEGERETIGANPPNVTLSQGSRGIYVLELQFILNSIAPFYDSIPFVIQDSVFDAVLKNAVIEFQKTFNLTPDGIVGPGTWNKLYAVYRGVDENVTVPPAPPPQPTPPNTPPPYPGTPLRVGSSGADVRTMQTYLDVVRMVYPGIPYVVVDGIFGERTRESVVAFQQQFLLAPDGVIGPITWDYIVKMFLQVTGGVPVSLEYPGVPLRQGSAGSSVRLMQGFLSDLRSVYPNLPTVTIDGVFGPSTQVAVVAFQRQFGLSPDGIIGPLTWNEIVRQRNTLL